MMMHPHRHPFWDLSLCFVIATTLILIRAPTACCADDASYLNCSSTIQCGDLQNISYPFWGLNRASYCGLPEFELTCQDNTTPLITISNQDHRVLRVDGTSQMTIARNDYWNNICPASFINTTQDITTPFAYTSDTVASNLTLYYGCGGSTSQVWSAIISSQFNCTINNTKVIGYFITKNVSDITTSNGFDLSNITSYFGACKTSVVLAANQSAIEGIEMTTTPTNTTVVSAIDEGFGLQWTVASQCSGCLASGGQCGRDNSSGDFKCYCPDKPYSSICPGSKTRLISSPAGVLVIIGVSVSAIAIIFVLKIKTGIFSWKVLLFHSEKDRDVEKLMGIHGSLVPRRYRYIDLKKMTNSFSEKLGQGGFGAVYKGQMRDGCLVAVKILLESKSSPEEFINEVVSISRTSHVNVITLLGFCYEGKKRALIFDYMPNGSLDKFIYFGRALHMSSSLEWKILYQIAIGIAHGLEYLHRGCNTRILHFDIKPQNILLDVDFIPKISDFGLAKLCHGQESAVSTLGMRGTVGFIAPEVVFRNLGRVSHKSDVYSYGMLVLEMVGFRNSDMEVSNESEMYFPEWIYRSLEPGKDLKLPMNATEEEEVLVKKMMIVSLWCIQTSPSDRPPIVKVIEMLEGNFDSLQMPPKPILYSPTQPPLQHWEMMALNSDRSLEETILENSEESSNTL
ncbi:LEAF RUST 10 DISEASE-RESISTANCE LOCUS RECEPTOR-LIKE PROTEIN KINASE-like 2.5 [Syzygium oleosum]|uniref:LEAF RUST 10 DISEASE-RESISTANCE LOCUS RECEPTOR-LIKE PROTEIN KINASE-like 2.5 n=1 Tax=Syzygium oleosum TaxID=219896 RepID=UPI0024B905A5|nr:LEAF RUST 10 DISEASE-RESISTANCE LOCUS RECEPTOR-LIKE PROTEIN KINASE-like 2.5 [Syzygium oleosum]